MNKLVCIVGMTGSGKSVVSDEFVKAGYGYVRFGQITLDEVIRRGEKPTEKLEKEIREGFRAQHGMGAYATLNIPKFDELLEKGNVLGDGLYSWTEYKILKEKYKENLFVLAIFSPPTIRYNRLVNRSSEVKDDPKLRYRSFTLDEAKSRDYAEIENIEKGGPIAMADFTIVNVGNMDEVIEKTTQIIKELENK
jgi:dephospho-CoA kinase